MAVLNQVGNSLTGLTGTGTFVGSNSPTITTPVIAQINDANGNEALVMSAVGSAVNYMTVANSVTGDNPGFTASGSDADIGITFNAKGTGSYQFAATASQAAQVVWFEDTDNGTNSITVAAPASIASNQTVTWKSASTGSPVLDTTDSDAWTDFSGSVGYTGFSVNPATNVARYKRIGNIVFINIITGNGTSNATTFTITGLPFTSAGISQQFPMAQGVDNSVGFSTQAASGQIAASTTVLICVLDNNGAGWTAANNKAAQFSFAYECA